MKISKKISYVLEYNSKEIQVEKIGKGMFWTAYQEKNSNNVFLVGKANNDYSKEAVALWCSELKHIPKLERVYRDEDTEIFKTVYTPGLKAKDRDAWSDYKKLRGLWENYLTENLSPTRLQFVAQNFRTVLDDADIKESLKEALEEMIEAVSNYDGEWLLEFAPRNLGVDEEGNLILLDILYDRKKLK